MGGFLLKHINACEAIERSSRPGSTQLIVIRSRQGEVAPARNIIDTEEIHQASAHADREVTIALAD